MLVGGVALAQQGLIVEPWRKAPAPVATPIPPLRAMPASGLGGPASVPPVRSIEAVRPSAAAFPAVESPKWSPPVVELLVDPWAKAHVGAPAQKPRWVPSTIEIVDPWADERRQPEPRVASHRAERAERGSRVESTHSPIF
jgi:hypothetical protein